MIDRHLPDVFFRGHDKFIAAVDAAIALGDAYATTAALRDALCALIRDPEVKLPAFSYDPIADHYARRELYRSPKYGYSIIAMTWGPGQGTPVHDHDGLWCVEGVWQGELLVTPYDLVETDGDRYRFRTTGTMRAGYGSSGSLIPPYEYHTISNPNPNETAVSVHIYKAPLEHYSFFVPQADDWYQRVEGTLQTDSTH